HNLDLMELAPELFFTVRQQQRDLGELGGFARVRAFEDDVLHLAAAKRLGALLAQHPADGVGDVALSATVGTDNRGYTGLETEGRVVGKTFETVELESLEMH